MKKTLVIIPRLMAYRIIETPGKPQKTFKLAEDIETLAYLPSFLGTFCFDHDHLDKRHTSGIYFTNLSGHRHMMMGNTIMLLDCEASTGKVSNFFDRHVECIHFKNMNVFRGAPRYSESIVPHMLENLSCVS